jgi:hypothetical protein
MFEQPVGKVEKDRSRLIMALSGAAVVVVIALIILVGSRGSSEPAPVEMAHSGSPEFDSYSSFVQITNVAKSTAERLHNKVGIIRCRVMNTGEKTLVGLQLRGIAVGFDNQVLKETVITPIPRVKDSLGPNQFIPIELFFEPLPSPDQVMEMTIELYGLKIK